jgi:hypothetical protein
MSELSRREAITLAAAATLVAPAEASAADPKPTQLLFDVLAAPPDPLSIPINIISKQGRSEKAAKITVRAATADPGTPVDLLTAEFKANDVVNVNLSVRLKYVAAGTTDAKPQDLYISVKEDGFVDADTNEGSPKKNKKITVGKANCVPPASATMRLSTQPVEVGNDNKVTIKCVAPQPPLDDASRKARLRMNSVTVEFFPTDPSKIVAAPANPDQYKLLVITNNNPSMGPAVCGLSDDGLLQADVNLGKRPDSGMGWIRVTWSVRPADAVDNTKDQAFAATNLIYFQKKTV